MPEKNVKRGFSLSAPVKRYASYLDLNWNGSTDVVGCATAIVKDIDHCWVNRSTGPVPQRDVDLFFHGPTGITPVSLKSSMADYLRGAGSAMNPFPQEDAQFCESDLEAMVADWGATLSDMDTVFKALDGVIEKYGQREHEQSDGWTEPTEFGRLERDRSKAIT
jgi:hypothetical protein